MIHEISYSVDQNNGLVKHVKQKQTGHMCPSFQDDFCSYYQHIPFFWENVENWMFYRMFHQDSYVTVVTVATKPSKTRSKENQSAMVS